MAYLFSIMRRGSDFSAQAHGERAFFVGRRVEYEGKIGLYNIFTGSRLEKLYYQSADHAGQFGFWAHFIEPTAYCEGRSFLTLNTYDRAAFTFGFGQFAAHVPNGDFIRYFRDLLGMAESREYFPHLGIVDGHVHRVEFDSKPVPLENDESTAPLMAYLNPNLGDVQDEEVIAAAKLIHWTSQHAPARAAQVRQMVATYRTFMRRADQRVGIDRRPAKQCCVIADILHHGRGGRETWPKIDRALRQSDPYEALLTIGLPKWKERIRTLRNAIAAAPILAETRWDSATHDFV